MTAQPQTVAVQAARVRCRQIVESDLDGLADLLTKGFPLSCRSYWTNGFARWPHLPVVEGLPRYGFVLDSGSGPVGVLLLLSSKRGDRVLSNLSSWYVEPEWRSHSTLLVSVATKLKHVTYLNASPAPHTERTLEAQGFTPYNFGRSAVFALPGRGSVSQTIPEITKIAWRDKQEEIVKLSPGVRRDTFVFNLTRRDFEREFGASYTRPGLFARFFGFLYRLLPKRAFYNLLLYAEKPEHAARG